MRFPVAFLCGAGAGLLTGLVHTKAKIPSFVASLGAMGLWTGVAFTLSKATPITVSQANYHYLKWVSGATGGIPNVIFTAMACLVICYILAEHTPFGRYVKVIGAGERAAHRFGGGDREVQDPRVCLCAALAGLSGIMRRPAWRAVPPGWRMVSDARDRRRHSGRHGVSGGVEARSAPSSAS